MEKPVLENGLYRHYKGNIYKVVDVVLDTETSEWMVLYCSVEKEFLDQNKEVIFFVRPYKMFTESIKINNELLPRFTQLYS